MSFLDRLSDPAFLCLASKKARKFLLSRQWYHARGSQEAFVGALTFNAWRLATSIKNGRYEPSLRTVFAAPKTIVGTSDDKEFRFRPLAVQCFEDEVVETALVMLLADHFEAPWGDPETDAFPALCSYGNRIFRRPTDSGLELAIGSSHLYRGWPEDYSSFVRQTAESYNRTLSACGSDELAVLFSSDLTDFFPSIKRARIIELVQPVVGHDEGFARIFERVFGRYSIQADSHVSAHVERLRTEGLLQGPVHSGFWSNVYLSAFDEWVKGELNISLRRRGFEGQVEFYGRYVDDFHIALRVKRSSGAALGSDALAASAALKKAVAASLGEFLNTIHLSLSEAKTGIIVQDAAGSFLTTGQVAERMAAISKKAYFPLPPDDLLDLEAQVRYLFSSGPDQTASDTAEPSGQQPLNLILDNPGVRAQSRKRFAAGKWLKISRDLEHLRPSWGSEKLRFASELVREWIVDPTQVQLLQRALDAGLRPHDMAMFLQVLAKLKVEKSRPFFDFVWAYLLDQCIYSGKDWGISFGSVVEEAIAESTHPVLVERALAWRLKHKRAVTPAESQMDGNLRTRYWLCRQLLWDKAKEQKGLTAFELGALISSVHASPKVYASLASKALNSMDDSGSRGQLVRSLLLRNPAATHVLAQSYREDVIELLAFEEPLVESDRLFYRIMRGEYRNPMAWFTLAEQLGILIAKEGAHSAARGLLHPFSIRVNEDGTLSLLDGILLTAYSGGPDGSSPEAADSSWCFAVGLILRAAATADAVDLIGATPIARYSIAGTMLWLARRESALGSKAADLLDRLAWWPGSRINPFVGVEQFLATVAHLKSAVPTTVLNEVVISDVLVNASEEGSPLCIALCQLRTAPKTVSDASVRRALSITRTMLQEKGAGEKGPHLVIFPEMSVPRASIGTLCRFARTTGCIVLAGLELISDLPNKCSRNELAWIVPLDRATGRVIVLKQAKIFVTSKEQALKLPVIPATPPIVWRLIAGRERMAAINCFEFTYLPLRELLRGRVELMVVSANNQDVTTFDNLMESTHYDLYSHVVLVNSERHGGSSVRAPYKDPWHRRIFDIHGEDLFSVNVCYVDLLDFRMHSPAKGVKTRPAGFKLHSP